MTNDELKALCLQVECSSFERDVAESILRLLAQCEAMREQLDDVREFLKMVVNHESQYSFGKVILGNGVAHAKDLLAHLSQLGERT